MGYLLNVNLLAAAEYSCDAYGAAAYGECVTASTGNPASSNLLASTGYDILLPLALGTSVLIAGIILLVKQALRRKQNHR